MEGTNQLVLTFLLNVGWQLAVITAVATLCAWLLRKTSARYQHRLWVVALIFSFGLPVLSISRLFDGNFFSEHQRQQPVTQSAIADTASLFQPGLLETATPVPASLKETAPFLRINRNIAAGLISLYVLFLCLGGLKLLRAWLKTRAISRGAYPIEFSDHVQAVIGECRAVVGVKKVRILCSTDVTVPITIGSLNPLVIVPEQLLREADPDVLTSAIGHELVHVLRRDCLFNLIYELIYLPLSFHPAAALVRRRIRQTRELRCDELVTEKLVRAEVYARSLVRLAGSAIALSRSTTTLSVGITDADILEERVMTMLRRSKISGRRKNLLLLATALIFAVPCMAAAPFSLPISIMTQDDAITSRQEATQVAKTQTTQEMEGRELSEAAMNTRLEELETRRREERQVQNSPATPQHNDSEEAKQQEQRAQREAREGEVRAREERAKEERLREEREKIETRIHPLVLQEQEARAKGERAKEERLREEREKLETRIHSIVLKDVTLERVEGLIEELKSKDRELITKRQAELAKKVNITMQQAIQIATNQQPGTVLECRLAGEGDEVYYRAQILTGDDPVNISALIFISALDGRVVKVEREKR